MKQDNNLCGWHRITDELKKNGIALNPTMVKRIIQTLEIKGKFSLLKV
jgi:hypothetical protein